jgi:hypothetical protein
MMLPKCPLCCVIQHKGNFEGSNDFRVDGAQKRYLHANRSLLLIDEFGKGTDPINGIALLAK